MNKSLNILCRAAVTWLLFAALTLFAVNSVWPGTSQEFKFSAAAFAGLLAVLFRRSRSYPATNSLGSPLSGRVTLSEKPRPSQEPSPAASSRSDRKVFYTLESLEHGALKVTITALGLSGREFKGPDGLREKVSNLKGAKFTADNNPARQTRTLVATVRPDNVRQIKSDLKRLFGEPTDL